MLLYAIGNFPVIRKTRDPENWIHAWFASSFFSDFHYVLEWLKMIAQEGPTFGYFPEQSKWCLVVAPELVEEAENVFEDHKVNKVTGHK